jgi:hypothetical protein
MIQIGQRYYVDNSAPYVMIILQLNRCIKSRGRDLAQRPLSNLLTQGAKSNRHERVSGKISSRLVHVKNLSSLSEEFLFHEKN